MRRLTEGQWSKEQFARHDDGRIAVRLGLDPMYPWVFPDVDDNGEQDGGTDLYMARNDWHPVTTEPERLDGLTIREWRSKWEACKRHAQEVEEAISRRNFEAKQLRIEKWEHRDVVDGKTASEWKKEAEGWKTVFDTQERVIEALKKKLAEKETHILTPEQVWESYHEIPEGVDVIPQGVRYGHLIDNDELVFHRVEGAAGLSHKELSGTFRTRELLTESCLAWMNAPAVIAHTRNNSERAAWAKGERGWIKGNGYLVPASFLIDPTPLYPEGEKK